MKISTVGQILFVCLFACSSWVSRTKLLLRKRRSKARGWIPWIITELLRGASKEKSSGRRANGVAAFFLEASPERLQVIRKTIERVEKMTPEERKSMRARLKRFREKASRPIENDEGFPHETGFAEPLLENFGPETRVREMSHYHQLSLPQRPKYLEKVRKILRPDEAKKPKVKNASPN